MILYIKGKLYQAAVIIGLISSKRYNETVVRTQDGYHAINKGGVVSAPFTAKGINDYADMVGDTEFKVETEDTDDGSTV